MWRSRKPLYVQTYRGFESLSLRQYYVYWHPRRPILPVHDEVVFPEVNKDFMLIALIAAFWHVLGEAGEFGTLKVKSKRLVCGEIEDEVIELDLNRGEQRRGRA
jgi:hypothetical protein